MLMTLRDPFLQILNLMLGCWYLSVAAKYVNLVTIIQLGKLLHFALDKLLVMPKTRVKPPILLPRSPQLSGGFLSGGCGFLVAGLDEERRPYLRATVLPNTNNINKSCYIKLEGTNNRNNILIPKNIVNHSILLKEMIGLNIHTEIPIVVIPSNLDITSHKLKIAMNLIVRFYSYFKTNLLKNINVETINKNLVKYFENLIDNNKNDMINILKLTNYLQFISLQQNILIVFRTLIQNPEKSFNIIDILYKSYSVDLPDFDGVINMIFPTVKNKEDLNNIFEEFNNENINRNKVFSS